VRVEQLLLEQMARDLLEPLRLDVGDAAAEQARGLDQFGARRSSGRVSSSGAHPG
jgi:hypothetical protein